MVIGRHPFFRISSSRSKESTRQIMAESFTQRHIFPFTMKPTPPNILFSTRLGVPASASLTLLVSFSLWVNVSPRCFARVDSPLFRCEDSQLLETNFCPVRSDLVFGRPRRRLRKVLRDSD